MIHVVKEKRLNDFKKVHCVKAKDLFSRLGNRVPNTNFECSDEPIPMNMSKIDSLAYMEDYDRRMQMEQDFNSSSESETDNLPDSQNVEN